MKLLRSHPSAVEEVTTILELVGAEETNAEKPVKRAYTRRPKTAAKRKALAVRQAASMSSPKKQRTPRHARVTTWDMRMDASGNQALSEHCSTGSVFSVRKDQFTAICTAIEQGIHKARDLTVHTGYKSYVINTTFRFLHKSGLAVLTGGRYQPIMQAGWFSLAEHAWNQIQVVASKKPIGARSAQATPPAPVLVAPQTV